MKSIEITVSGDVQNKGFRFCTSNVANTLGIKGYVRFNINNELFIAAEGEEDRLDQLVRWCRKGFSAPSVLGIVINDSIVKGYQSFDIVFNKNPDGTHGTHSSILKRFFQFIFHTKNHHIGKI